MLVKYLVLGSPLLRAAHPAHCLQDLENLSVQRADVKAVVTLYGYIFESKVLTAGTFTGGKKTSRNLYHLLLQLLQSKTNISTDW